MQRLAPDLEAVLVIGPNWIGDAVMSTPALANLRRGLPKARIDLLVPRHVAPLFDDHPHIDRVVVRDERQPWRTRLAQVMALRTCGYQMVLLLPNSFHAALDAWLLRSPIRLGYATDGRRWLLTHAVPCRRGATASSDRGISAVGRCHGAADRRARPNAGADDTSRNAGGAPVGCPGLGACRPGHRHLPGGCLRSGQALVARAVCRISRSVARLRPLSCGLFRQSR